MKVRTRSISRALVMVLALTWVGCASEGGPEGAATEATLAGRAEDGDTFVVVVRNGTSFMAYVCDDERDAWFRAESLATPMELDDGRGNQLFLALGEDDTSAVGQVTFGEEEPLPFALEATEEEVLFRAEGALSGEPLLAGWIRLPDGEQRGLIRRRTTTVTSRLSTGVVRVASPEEFGRLAPAAFTPPSLAATTRARAERFDLYALGDSYGAGEGAPEIPGDYDEGGVLLRDGQREVWNTELDEAGEREARACHRSGISGVEVAADLLRRDYAGAIDLSVRSFACSGSQTEHFLTCNYRGAIGDHFSSSSEFLRPQISRVREASRSAGVDAVYMSIGGNDMRFGALIANCLTESLLGEGLAGDVCGAASPIDGVFRRATRDVAAKYRAIADALRPLVPSEHVCLAQAPNPVVDSRGAPCAEVDLLDFGGMGILGGDEVAWLGSFVVPEMNRTIALNAETNGWTLVSGHLERFLGHGYCSSDPWFVDNPTSLGIQGRWMTDALDSGDFPRDRCISPAESADDPGPVSPAVIAGGVVHPNAEGYAPAIADSMRAQVEDHIRPAPAAGLRVQVQARLGGVRLAWDERASTETEYRMRVRYTEIEPGTPAMQVISLPRDSRTADLPLFGRARGTVEVFGCYVGPAPSRREVCAEARSVSFSNFAPTAVVSGVRVDTTLRAPLVPGTRLSQQRLVRVLWNRATEEGVVYYDIELHDTDGSSRRLATTEPSFVASAQLARAQVRACNFLGCAAPSLVVMGPSCARGEIVGIDSRCAPGESADLSPRDLACPGLVSDPAGICGR